MNSTVNQLSLSDRDKIDMETTLIDGEFSSSDALQVITRLFEVKIRYHEEQIGRSAQEEDIKMRERKIRQLQQNLADIRDYIRNNGQQVWIHANVHIN